MRQRRSAKGTEHIGNRGPRTAEDAVQDRVDHRQPNELLDDLRDDPLDHVLEVDRRVLALDEGLGRVFSGVGFQFSARGHGLTRKALYSSVQILTLSCCVSH